MTSMDPERRSIGSRPADQTASFCLIINIISLLSLSEVFFEVSLIFPLNLPHLNLKDQDLDLSLVFGSSRPIRSCLFCFS